MAIDRSAWRTLIVDDQDSMRQLLRMCLRGLAITNVADAEDGERALAVLASRPMDLVLLDGEMPKLSGVETLKRIREAPATANLPVIMVTGRSDMEFVKQIAALRVSGYVVKPVSAALLGARIDAAMQTSARPLVANL
jgi:two-component system, chemotaxis family, chemotaxis protein CheY